MPGLLNYTTKVDAARTISEIQARLGKAGARNVTVDYADGLPVALSFAIETPIGLFAYRLPADVDAVQKLLIRQAQTGQLSRTAKFFSKEQAARVGWRIVKDWLEAQLALIETEMVRLEQIMMPFLVMDTGRTLYEAFRDRQFALPAASAER